MLQGEDEDVNAEQRQRPGFAHGPLPRGNGLQDRQVTLANQLGFEPKHVYGALLSELEHGAQRDPG
jgi:hypothetical protein